MGTLSVPDEPDNAHPQITYLKVSPDGRHIAAGYVDGMIRLFNYDTMTLSVALNGHRKAVTALAFNSDGTRLASGSQDTDCILWDIVGEVGIARFRGHKDQVTSVVLLETNMSDAHSKKSYLITASKDTLVKVWDLNSLHCVQTVVGIRSEVWSLGVSPSKDRLFVGSADNQLREYSIGAAPRVAAGVAGVLNSTLEQEEGGDVLGDSEVLIFMGSLTRQSGDRVETIDVSNSGLVSVQSSGKLLEVYKIRTESETRKRVIRRLRRQREKLAKKKDSSKEGPVDDADVATPSFEFDLAGTSLELLDAQLRKMEEEMARVEREEIHGGDEEEPASNSEVKNPLVIATDELELVGLAHAPTKISSFATLPGTYDVNNASGNPQQVQFLLALSDNQLQVHSLPLNQAAVDALGTKDITTSAGTPVPLAHISRTIDMGGHRSDVRSVVISQDGTLILTCSLGEAKVWNSTSGNCIRTLTLNSSKDVALSAGFGPGARHAIVGTKEGFLYLFDLASGDVLESHEAHSGAVWSVAVRPDEKGCATGSADKEIKFWDFELKAPSDQDKKGKKKVATPVSPESMQLTLSHSRTLKIGDEVLAIKYSKHSDPEKLLIAAALLDSTIKVFFDDSLKFFLSLYGHKLPVLSLDISADSTLLVSASADKSVKVWGLDFGDCHKSFHAHADPVTSVAFVSRTHYFFTASKDKTIKYWDGDRFEQILTLQGHKGHVWSTAVSQDGLFMVSTSSDRSVRVWRRTDEQVFLDEERDRAFQDSVEKEAVNMNVDDILHGTDKVGAIGSDGLAVTTVEEDGKPVLTHVAGAMNAGLVSEVSGIVANPTRETGKDSDRLMDALSLVAKEVEKWTEYAQDLASARAQGAKDEEVEAPPRNPELLGLTPAAYILRVLRQIRPSDLNQVLLVLPFPEALKLLKYMYHNLRRGAGIELCTKVTLLLLRIHSGALTTAHQTHLPLLNALKSAMQDALLTAREAIGFNVAGLRFLDTILQDVEAGSAEFAPSVGDSVLSDAGVMKARAKKKEKTKERGFRAGKRQKVQLL